MGDGGVACIPLQQQQQHIMETFPIPSEKMLCAAKNNGFNSKSSVKFSGAERKQKMKVKKEELVVKDVELGRTESGSDKPGKSSREVGHAENGADNAQKDEVEEGELGTLKWSRVEVENGEFVPEKSRRGGTENSEKWRKAEIEKGEHVRGKWRRGDIEKGEIVSEKSRKSEAENRSRRLAKDEIERGEFIPDRWEKGDTGKDDFRYSRTRRYESDKDRGWKSVREPTPPIVKYSTDDVTRRKELNRSGSQHSKSTSRWESGQDRGSRYSSKALNDELTHRTDYSDGKNFGKDYSSSNRLKRYSLESDNFERKHYGDYGDYAGSKSRRLSEDTNRAGHSDHYSSRPLERSCKNSSSSRVSSSDKFSSRHYESSSTSSREAYNRHGHSPGHSDRSPRDKARYYDHRDRSPAHRDRSPYIGEKSPYGRDKSPYGRDKSPYDRSRQYDHRYRSPHAERSPQDRARCHGRRDRTPNYLERSPLDRSRSNNHRETSRKGKGSEKNSLLNGSRTREDKTTPRDLDGRESIVIAKESCDEINVHHANGSLETVTDCKSYEGEESQSPNQACKELSHVDGVPEELPSMEEDMDICDTPPHAPLLTDTSTGKWFYLDYYGVERGPTRLYDLKALVEEGSLMPDHFIKHLDSDRWVTVENAVSPLVTINFPSIVSDSVTQLVSPPEAPGNVLADAIDTGQLNIQSGDSEHNQIPSRAPILCSDEVVDTSEPLGDLHIDERIGALLEDITVIPGRELETIAGTCSNLFHTSSQISGNCILFFLALVMEIS